jgi:hypothetical protein
LFSTSLNLRSHRNPTFTILTFPLNSQIYWVMILIFVQRSACAGASNQLSVE